LNVFTMTLSLTVSRFIKQDIHVKARSNFHILNKDDPTFK